MSKHTPGPWGISKIGNNYDQYMIQAKGGERICNTVEGKDNARLIAAAPELLEACETALSQLVLFYDKAAEHFLEITEGRPKYRLERILEDAIQKAEGENQ